MIGSTGTERDESDRPGNNENLSDVSCTKLRGVEQFVIAFVESRAAIAQRAAEVVAALDDDTTLWMAYPKKSTCSPN